MTADLLRAALAASVLAGCTVDDRTSAEASPVVVASEIERALAPYVERGLLSGTVTVSRGSEVVFARAYGTADILTGTPNDLAQARPIASMSKPITRLAMLALADDPRYTVELGDRVSTHLPDYPPENLRGGGVDVTIDHLLDHRSCLQDPGTFVPVTTYLAYDNQDMVDLLRDQPLKPGCVPGTEWSYSNAGVSFVGAIIERVTGKTYVEYLTEMFFSPSHMTTTNCLANPPAHVALVRGHDKVGDTLVRWTRTNYPASDLVPGCLASGSLYSTGTDLARFYAAVIDGELVDLERALAPRVALGPLDHTLAGYAIDYAGTRVYFHGGYHQGHSTWLGFDPGNGWVVSVLLNYAKHSLGEDMEDWTKQIGGDVFAAIYGQATKGPGQIFPVTDAMLLPYTGSFGPWYAGVTFSRASLRHGIGADHAALFVRASFQLLPTHLTARDYSQLGGMGTLVFKPPAYDAWPLIYNGHAITMIYFPDPDTVVLYFRQPDGALGAFVLPRTGGIEAPCAEADA